MYESQTLSKHSRDLRKILGTALDDELNEQLEKKHFKKYYAGKPTKRYLRIIKKIEKADAIPYNMIVKALFN